MEGKCIYQIFQIVLMLMILFETSIPVQCDTTTTPDSQNVSASVNQTITDKTTEETNADNTTTGNTTEETNSSTTSLASSTGTPVGSQSTDITTSSASTMPAPETQTTTESIPQNSTQEQKAEDKPDLIIIVAVTAAAGILVGVGVTVIIFRCMRKKGGNRTTRQLSLKRNLSYDVNNVNTVAENSTKPIPEYIQILPDIDAYSYTDVKLENGSVKIVSDDVNTNTKTNTEDDYDIVDEDEKRNESVKIVPQDPDDMNIDTKTSTEDDYDIVDEDEKQKPDLLQLPHEDYSHINHKGRKISETSYSHLANEQDNVSKFTDNSGTTRNSCLDTHGTRVSESKQRWDTKEDDYSNLSAKIDNALQAMDKTIATYEYDNTREYTKQTGDGDSQSEYDEDELYNHLGSLKMKNGYENDKLNLGNPKRTRSRSLPAQDLQPQVKSFCDDADTYNHVMDYHPKREPTYYNWKPVRYAKSRSLPEQENLEHTKNMENDIDTYSHINLGKKNHIAKRKIGVAAKGPDHAYLELKDQTNDVVNNIQNNSGKDTGNMVLNNYSNTVKPDPKTSNVSKSSVFTIQENDGIDEEGPHSYFILEPITTAF